MNACPACGLPNDENAKFCKECRARLDTYTRARPSREFKNVPPPLPPPAIAVPSRIGLATIGLILGIFGIGIPALFVGIIALRRDPLHRGRAQGAIIIGAVGTIVLAVALILALPKGDPLRRHITPDQVSRFTDAAYDRIMQVEEEARVMGEHLGPGADAELGPVYGRLHALRTRLDDLSDITDEESLNIVRAELVSEIDSARAYLKNH